MKEEIHLTKKDFKLAWFSGTGAGGQHRNKHQNCCRITHIATGLKTQGTGSRDRVTNQRVAFTNLAKLIISYYDAGGKPERYKSLEVIRNYHGVRNEVKDKASGLRQEYKHVVDNAHIEDMVEARLDSMLARQAL